MYFSIFLTFPFLLTFIHLGKAHAEIAVPSLPLPYPLLRFRRSAETQPLPTGDVKKDEVGGPKPRCLQTLFGGMALGGIGGLLDGYTDSDSSDLSEPPTLQGGIMSGPSDFGGYPSPSQSFGGFQSPPQAPGLPSHMFDAVNNANLMNSQLGTMNSQMHSQFSGVSGPSFPMSPSFRYGMNGFSSGINSEYSGVSPLSMNANMGNGRQFAPPIFRYM